MKKTPGAASPQEYLEGLSGWQRTVVDTLRGAVLAAGHDLDEVIKWGHLVYSHHGPVLLIRAEDERVLLGFWRGKRLRDIQPALKPGGKYEMATLTILEGDAVDSATVEHLTREAVSLNASLGDPRDAARKST